MKRFIIVSLLLMTVGRSMACVPEKPTYNYYLMCVEPTQQQTDSKQLKAINDFWKQYTNGRVEGYVDGWDSKTNTDAPTFIMKLARQKKDYEMVRYLGWLNKYLKISRDLTNTWEYPTREQLLRRRQGLTQMLAAAKAYRGRRLLAQYRLLAMRANMLLGYNTQNISYWKTTASRMPQSVYRDMMENIYARALLKTGKQRDALEIYARQNDQQSMRWCVRHYRNLSGIKAIYARDANSRVLPYLVQDFVNNMQETQDVYTRPSAFIPDADKARWTKKEYTEAIEEVGARAIYQDEAQAFIAFAAQVLKEGKTTTPALWHEATGALQFLLGDYSAARASLARAITAEGTQRMHDNARAIADINSVYTEKMDEQQQSHLIKEIEWMRSMTKLAETKDEQGITYVTDTYFANMLQRMVYNHLVPELQKQGNGFLALAMLANMDNHDNDGTLPSIRKHVPTYYQPANSYNDLPDWSGDYYDALQHLTVDSLKQYVAYLHATHTDSPLAEAACKSSYLSDDYYNDLIGTRLMAAGHFEEAIPYLKKVSTDFIYNSNICGYIGRRNYQRPRWFVHQVIADTLQTGPRSVAITGNQKLTFCQDITNLQHRYQNASSDTLRARLAYDLATRLYQASYEGDCWYLTHYDWSCLDSVRTGDRDLILDAINYLDECSLKGDKNIQFKSLYALAFIRRDNAAEGYPFIYPDEKINFQKQTRQYKALTQLDNFLTLNPAYQSNPYVSHCDVLRMFREQ
ncbi:hypothetical protein [Hallella absiana]|uniref:hypothetical protein n=1 Tax=Hallella absiana TaxID=2925336 RepID=UPI0021CA513C|nr:hypothetical protein [Hallella absiana]